jgi:hypothetical protein
MRPLGHMPEAVVPKVNELLLAEGGGWNVQKLRDTFFHGDVDAILKIPVGRAGTEDYLAWNYTKNWFSSVKSVYHRKQHIKQLKEGRAGSSSSYEEHHGWLSIWSAQVPGKVSIAGD